MDYMDIFEDEGELDIPTMRGDANLDVQDYSNAHGPSDTFLQDGLQEDTLSTPGRNPGAAPAPDIEGTSEYDLLDETDGPGMDVTEYGSYPWGPGSGTGYRPHSMQRTDMSLRALASDEDYQPTPRQPERDDMHFEPEVINAVPTARVPREGWAGNRNRMPSNREVDPMTLYDRSSYEQDDSTQSTIGSGIFGMEEGVTWNPRDGIFANQYALPAYLAEEDPLGVEQSEMWDTVADEWRVVQPSGGGVTFETGVDELRDAPAYSPFAKGGKGASGKRRGRGVPSSMRPESTGPRSHVEAFGRNAASLIVEEARSKANAKARDAFLRNALDSLGPRMATRCKAVADRLIKMGYRPDVALEDAIAHCVMHATVQDLTTSRRGSLLPRLDQLAKKVQRTGTRMRQSAQEHVAPLVQDNGKLRSDLGSLYASPAASGMGAVANGASAETAVATAPGLLRPRNFLIAGAVLGGGYLAYRNRDTIKKTWKKMTK